MAQNLAAQEDFTLSDDIELMEVPEDNAATDAAETAAFLLSDTVRKKFGQNDHRTDGAMGATLLHRMAPILHTLQFLGIYCLPVSGVHSFNRISSVYIGIFLITLVVIYTLVNLLLFVINMHIYVTIQDRMGLLNANTLGSMVTGIKPFVNIVHFVFFAVTVFAHRSLLRQMVMIDNTFSCIFRLSVDVSGFNRQFFYLLFFFTLPLLSLRLIEYVVMKETPGANLLNDLSVLLVPLLSTWNAVPLVYFVVLTGFIRVWFGALHQAVIDDPKLTKRNLRFYYRQFLRLTRIVQHVGKVFNPFIFFTILWTIFTLCLSIYFATQADTLFDAALMNTDDPNSRTQAYFNVLYCGIQVLLAACYVGTLCVSGVITNEKAREILQSILEVQPESVDPFDRFQIVCFMQKIETQYMWGVSVWWAVPVERSMLFTLISVVITYALLLLKMQPHNMVSVLEIAGLENLKAAAQEKCLQIIQEIQKNMSTQCERQALATVAGFFNSVLDEIET